MEYHNVCPLAGIGTLPPPLSPVSVLLPPEPKGVGHTRLRGGAGESPNSDDWMDWTVGMTDDYLIFSVPSRKYFFNHT